jgi:small conductance mechanosensitive channel
MTIQELLPQAVVMAAAASLMKIIVIVIVTIIGLRFAGKVIDKLFTPMLDSKKFYLDEKRAKTLGVLLKSVLRYVVYFIAGVMILREFHIDTTSILAGAGIFGLAVGVGAQSIVRDVITGFFIIFEDQFAVGDYITTVELSGVVEELGFRIIKMRDLNGVLHIVPNGSIGKVTNFTRGTMQAAVNIPVAYDADVSKARGAVEEAVQEMSEMLEIIEGPQVVGIIDFNPQGVVFRIIAKVVPLEHVKVETALRARVKQKFDALGIKFASAAGLTPPNTGEEVRNG